jgi:hypothetical protein
MPIQKCPMCREVRPVLKSHLMPAALYKSCGTEEESPIRVGDGFVMPTDRQTWCYLLCAECEDILNRGGETWTIEKLATLKDGFPLYDLLVAVPGELGDEGEELYLTARNPSIDVEKLTHFAIGIFWKASVASWRGGETNPMIHLGPYSDGLRTWLRGETGFPQQICLTVTVSKPERAFITLNAPVRTEFKDWPTYLLHVPGVLFMLSVGRLVPLEMRMTCFHRTPTHPVFVSNPITDKFNAFLGKQLVESRKTNAYLKLIADRAKP